MSLRLAVFVSVCLSLLLGVAPARAWQYETISAHDGVPLVVAESGTPDGPVILFIHGYSQSLLSWKKQLNDPDLQAKFRMIAFDLRGHGASGKPWRPEGYTSEDWSGDVARVIEVKALARPILVGWSMGATVISAYVGHHGTEDIGGIVLVAGAVSFAGRSPPLKTDNPSRPPETSATRGYMQQMLSPDIETNLKGTSVFVHMLAAIPLDDETVNEALVYNMMLPAYARDAMFANQVSSEGIAARIDVPTLLIHGEADGLLPVTASAENQPLISNSRLLTYKGIGHAPFLEVPARFNRDLTDFASSIDRQAD